jgi:hydroxymethylpyrimidine kinase / phosphomethylpyrimidine kinase / thiamine-phosphate diphosphorylase
MVRIFGVIISILLHECCSFSLPAYSSVNNLDSSVAERKLDSITGSKPIVYTVAGSDSGGGAGIQADLKAIYNFHCHGCSAITCLTAQNSINVTSVHTPPTSFLIQQWNTLISDLPPLAIKIGMLGSKEMVMTMGSLLKELREKESNNNNNNEKVWIVLDPVMISTSGSRLIDHDAQQALINHVFPYVDIITPNIYEAKVLLEDSIRNGTTFSIQTYKDMEWACEELLQLGCNAVLLKGGHFPSNHPNGFNDDEELARDYLLIGQHMARTEPVHINKSRLCDAYGTSESPNCSNGVWLQSSRFDTEHTHGTGCTISAAIASALALGESCRRRRCHGEQSSFNGGAYAAMNIVDATCLAKAYVTAGISQSRPLDGAKGPGPVAHTTFPSSYKYYPTIQKTVRSKLSFLKFRNGELLSRVLPIVDSFEWIDRLCTVKQNHNVSTINDVQLRIKNENDPSKVLEIVQRAQTRCEEAKIRLWINDDWEAAIAANCFGVHIGQEDLYSCTKSGGIDAIHRANIALGISTHTFSELAVALDVSPSYISLGPIFATGSKKVQFEPQGLNVLHKWRELIPPDIPLVAIGGINEKEATRLVRSAGADCIAAIGAITGSCRDIDDIVDSIELLETAMLTRI